MKHLALALFMMFSLTPKAIAGPEFQSNSGSAIEVHSSDSNNIQVERVENVIENSVDLTSFIPKGLLISGIYEVDTKPRTCFLCWPFAVAFGLFLYFYGIRLKKQKGIKNDWFAFPLLGGLILYFVHGFLHQNYAANIFLQYYWMILFDELLVAYIWYYVIVAKSKSKKEEKLVLGQRL